MTRIDLSIEKGRRRNAIKRAKERNIVIPTFAQMKDPSKIPAAVKTELKSSGLWDLHPRNLFRITWHNEPKLSGGGYGGVNYLELPSSLTGVPARIVVLVGKWFPTGARRGLLLVPAAAGHRAVRPDHAKGCVALHRQLLPRWCL
jgi:hypothetical protein